VVTERPGPAGRTTPRAGGRPTTIRSLATYVPPRVLTNGDLEKMVETSDEWILQRTGIRERHIVDPGVATSDLGREAAVKAIERAGLTPADIGIVIVGTVTPDMLFPSTACLIQHKIGAPRAWGFDLSAACSAFTYALTTASQFVASGAHEHALVVGADVMSSIIDYQDRSTCVLFGDGAGAVVVSAADEGDGRILDFEHEIDGSGGSALCMPAGGSLHPPSHATVDAGMQYVKCARRRRSPAASWSGTGSPPTTSICSCRTRRTGASSSRRPTSWAWTRRRS
jgi:3-oxoacyl-[acyl-carrier-protein] synthase III